MSVCVRVCQQVTKMSFCEPISTMPVMPEALLCRLLLPCCVVHVCVSVCARERLASHTHTHTQAWNVLWRLLYGKQVPGCRSDAPLLSPAQTHCPAVTHTHTHTHTATITFFPPLRCLFVPVVGSMVQRVKESEGDVFSQSVCYLKHVSNEADSNFS